MHRFLPAHHRQIFRRVFRPLPERSFYFFYSRNQKFVLDIEVRHEVALTHYYIKQHGAESCAFFRFIVIYEYVLELVELGSHMIMVAGEFAYAEVAVGVIVEQAFDIFKHNFVFILHVFFTSST